MNIKEVTGLAHYISWLIELVFEVHNMALKTNYIDSVYTQKKYDKFVGTDGYYRFRDATDYDIIGDYYGANDINAQNSAYNNLATKFEIIASLIEKIEAKDIEITDNDINTILVAISNCATQEYYSAYNKAIQDTVAEVVAEPGKYNLVDSTLVNEINATITQNKQDIEFALTYIDSAIPFPPLPSQPIISFPLDVVTQGQAVYAQDELYAYASRIYEYCANYTDEAFSNMQSSIGVLREVL